MAAKFATWTGATHCTGSATPGARAAMKVVLDLFPGVRNGGIYNCRNVVGGSTTSCHGEGRADDFMCSIPVGDKLVRALLAAGPDRLGIQAIIHNRVIYSKKSPKGRPYVGKGLNPHTDHVHVEFTRSAGARLTAATVRAVLGGAPAPDPKPDPVDTGSHKPGSRTLHKGDKGPDVGVLQRFLGITDDGKFGPKTETAVKRYQRMRGLPQQGTVGPATWAPILHSLGLA